MPDELRFVQPKLLLVEGRDEERFFPSLFNYLGISNVQIVSYQGTPNFRRNLRAFMVTEGFDQLGSIGIVRDADQSAASALQSIQAHLGNLGLPVPDTFMTPTGSAPSVSVFVMPNNADKGALEKLCLESLQDDPAMRCTEEYVKCLIDALDELPENMDKAKMHAFLSSREKFYLHIGEAADAGCFDWNHPSFAQLAGFLQSL